MSELARLAELCQRLRASPGRLDKLALLADYLRALPADSVPTAVAFLTGRPFPPSDPRVLGVRWLPSGDEVAASGPPLTLSDVASAFAGIAEAVGAGSRRTRDELLRGLAARASADERETLQRIMVGEMRTGVSDGLVLEAIARAFEAPLESTRRAALRLGDLSAVAAMAARGGAAALTAASVCPGVPLLPMLAQIAEDFDEVLTAHGGTTALEYKYDGARIQLHRDGDRVSIWTRRLSDVTRSLPDVVETARRELAAAPFILDGEVMALDSAGRPLPFQELMRRFRRVHEVERLVREMPLTLYFFDCLMADGRSLIDEPYARRWETLTAVTGGRYLAERALVSSAEAAREFQARALAAGHEGVVAKDLRSTYEPGGRGKRWFKLKVAETVDCVIVAVDRGSGRSRRPTTATPCWCGRRSWSRSPTTRSRRARPIAPAWRSGSRGSRGSARTRRPARPRRSTSCASSTSGNSRRRAGRCRIGARDPARLDRHCQARRDARRRPLARHAHRRLRRDRNRQDPRRAHVRRSRTTRRRRAGHRARPERPRRLAAARRVRSTALQVVAHAVDPHRRANDRSLSAAGADAGELLQHAQVGGAGPRLPGADTRRRLGVRLELEGDLQSRALHRAAVRLFPLRGRHATDRRGRRRADGLARGLDPVPHLRRALPKDHPPRRRDARDGDLPAGVEAPGVHRLAPLRPHRAHDPAPGDDGGDAARGPAGPQGRHRRHRRHRQHDPGPRQRARRQPAGPHALCRQASRQRHE